MWNVPLYAVDMFYDHWLRKNLLWLMAGQNRARQETNAMRKKVESGRCHIADEGKDTGNLPVGYSLVVVHRSIQYTFSGVFMKNSATFELSIERLVCSNNLKFQNDLATLIAPKTTQKKMLKYKNLFS